MFRAAVTCLPVTLQFRSNQTHIVDTCAGPQQNKTNSNSNRPFAHAPPTGAANTLLYVVCRCQVVANQTTPCARRPPVLSTHFLSRHPQLSTRPAFYFQSTSRHSHFNTFRSVPSFPTFVQNLQLPAIPTHLNSPYHYFNTNSVLHLKQSNSHIPSAFRVT